MGDAVLYFEQGVWRIWMKDSVPACNYRSSTCNNELPGKGFELTERS